MGFSRKEYWSGLPFPSPEDLPDPGIKPVSAALAGEFFITEPSQKPHLYFYLGAKKILNLHWSSLYLNLYFMSSVHFLNICLTSPTIFRGKEPMLLPMSFMSFWKSHLEALFPGLCSFSRITISYFSTAITLTCILLLLLSNSIWFSQAPANHRILVLEEVLVLSTKY